MVGKFVFLVFKGCIIKQKPSDCTEINGIAKLIMFLWTAFKLAAVRALYSQGFFFSFQNFGCKKIYSILQISLRKFLFFFSFCMAGLGTDCQQSDHGLCYRQRWTSIRVCCVPDGEERFLGDLGSGSGRVEDKGVMPCVAVLL